MKPYQNSLTKTLDRKSVLFKRWLEQEFLKNNFKGRWEVAIETSFIKDQTNGVSCKTKQFGFKIKCPNTNGNDDLKEINKLMDSIIILILSMPVSYCNTSNKESDVILNTFMMVVYTDKTTGKVDSVLIPFTEKVRDTEFDEVNNKFILDETQFKENMRGAKTSLSMFLTDLYQKRDLPGTFNYLKETYKYRL